MKVGFVVTTHYSEKLRKDGREYINDYLNSLEKSCEYKYKVYLLDNGSTEVIDINTLNTNVSYNYIEDQTISGVTGAWNYGISLAIDDGCDIVINTNDDIVFNETINELIKTIKIHNNNEVSIYGPVTYEGGCPGPNNQERVKPGVGVLEVTETSNNSWNGGHGINGFFNAFTAKCYHNFEERGNLYSTEKKYMISGQESEMQVRLGRRGLKSFIVEGCIVRHKKIRGWQQL